MPNRGAILIPTREGEHGRFNFKCDQGATYGMTQLLYSDAIVGFLTEFAKTTDHRPEILLSFGFVPKVETKVGLINWLIQDPGNAAVADEQAFVRELAETEPAQQAADEVDLYKRVIDGVGALGFPLSVHLEATYGVSTPGVRDARRDARLLVARQGLTAYAVDPVATRGRPVGRRGVEYQRRHPCAVRSAVPSSAASVVGPLEVQVRLVLPGEPDPAVHLDGVGRRSG